MDLETRATRFAALGDPVRLALVDDLAVSDRSPLELAGRHGLASNLVAHHLGVLGRAGLIERSQSSGDRRRRYIHLRHGGLGELRLGISIPKGPVLFVCTHNSARSQMAAALWSQEVGSPAVSAGTHPAESVHPQAVAAAAKAGLDLRGSRPRRIADLEIEPSLVVTVCDQAHEELTPASSWWHWSVPDPVEDPKAGAFDLALRRLQARVRAVTAGDATPKL